MMDILIKQEKEKLFLEIVLKGAKLPDHFDMETIINKEEEAPMSILTIQMQAMQI